MKTDETYTPISLNGIRAAQARVYRFARPTPLWPFWEREGLWLKLENLQVTGSFKIRGATNFLLTHEDYSVEGVVTASSGNHGQAVAYVARRLGIRAIVVAPEDIPSAKAEPIQRDGAELIRWGRFSEERIQKARELALTYRLLEVPSSDHPAIIEGQGTVGLEILEQCPEVRTVYVPVSGGGLISGIAASLKLQRSDVRVIGVEPAAIRRFYASIQAGEPVTLPGVETIADGLRVVRPGRWTWVVARQWVDAWVAVDDAEILAAMWRLLFEAKVVAEPAGAAAVAAALRDGGEPPVVAVVSGGNLTEKVLRNLERLREGNDR